MKEYIEKLDHTLCLNHNEGNLKYNIDNEYHIDCVDMNEMLDCVDKVKNSMEVLDILIKYHFIGIVMYLCDSYKELLVSLIKAGVTDKDYIPSEEEYKIVHNWIEENGIDIDMI